MAIADAAPQAPPPLDSLSSDPVVRVGRRFLPVAANALPPVPDGSGVVALPVAPGTPVHAMQSGRVVTAEGTAVGEVVLRAEGDVRLVYRKLLPSSVVVSSGDTVEAGDLIGVVAPGPAGRLATLELGVQLPDGSWEQVSARLVGAPDPLELYLRPPNAAASASTCRPRQDRAGRRPTAIKVVQAEPEADEPASPSLLTAVKAVDTEPEPDQQPAPTPQPETKTTTAAKAGLDTSEPGPTSQPAKIKVVDTEPEGDGPAPPSRLTAIKAVDTEPAASAPPGPTTADSPTAHRTTGPFGVASSRRERGTRSARPGHQTEAPTGRASTRPVPAGSDTTSTTSGQGIPASPGDQHGARSGPAAPRPDTAATGLAASDPDPPGAASGEPAPGRQTTSGSDAKTGRPPGAAKLTSRRRKGSSRSDSDYGHMRPRLLSERPDHDPIEASEAEPAGEDEAGPGVEGAEVTGGGERGERTVSISLPSPGAPGLEADGTPANPAGEDASDDGDGDSGTTDGADRGTQVSRLTGRRRPRRSGS